MALVANRLALFFYNGVGIGPWFIVNLLSTGWFFAMLATTRRNLCCGERLFNPWPTCNVAFMRCNQSFTKRVPCVFLPALGG